MKLNELKKGETGRITAVGGEGALRQHFLDMGVIPGASITVMKFAQKKKVEKLKEFRPKFIAQAATKACDEDTANRIFDMIVDAGLYSFNMAHAVSYGLITYVSAYLKVHYPLEYMKNLLTNAYSRGEKESYAEILNDCRRMGIKFLPPDINKSGWEFTIEDGCIRVGMCAIKGFGEKASEQVLANRPFSSLEDMLERVEKRSFNKKVVNVACFSGLLDEIEGIERLDIYYKYMDNRGEEPEESLTFSKGFTINTTGSVFEFEEAILGGACTVDPANELESFGWHDMRNKQTFTTVGYVRKAKKIKTKKGEQMAFITLATGDGMIECTLFPKTYKETLKKIMGKNKYVQITARKDNDGCIVSKMEEIVA